MATRLTYTSGTRTPELDAAFERALEAARSDAHMPLAHVVGGEERTDGAEFSRADPSRSGAVASRAREAPDAVVHDAVAVAPRHSATGGARPWPSAARSWGPPQTSPASACSRWPRS
jgi:hypothetical protein